MGGKNMSRWIPEEIRLSQLKTMRNIYYQQKCYPRPKSSPYDNEIEELEKIINGE